MPASGLRGRGSGGPLALAAALLVALALVAPSLATAASDPTAKPSSKAATPQVGTPGKADPSAAEKAEGDTAAKKAAAAAELEAARKAAEQAHDTAALLMAAAALAEAEADLVRAREVLAESTAELEKARKADGIAQVELEVAVLAAQRATRDLAVVESRIAERERALGRLARSAYVSNGSMGEWAVVLSSSTPNQLADRLAFLQSVGSAGNAVLADLREDRADLLNAQAALSAARTRQESARATAAAALATVSTTAMMAKVAEQEVDAVVEVRKAAVAQARAAVEEDQRRYRVQVAYSGALATRIVGLAAELSARANPPAGTGQMARPGLGEVTSPYGPRLHPILRYVKVHTGTDFGAADGIAYAADDGVVLLTEPNEAYGNMTVIDHGTVGGARVSTLYAHQAAFGVEPGDKVFKGQAIGVIGSTGYSTGPHLHFEVRLDGQPVDPGPFLAGATLPSPPSAPHGSASLTDR